MLNSIALITPSGRTLSVKALGSGPAVILLHGFPLDHRMWTQTAEHLGTWFHCLIPELRGFGLSSLDDQYRIEDLADDIDVMRKHLAPDQQVHLIGLSMGGYVALEYWRKYGQHLKSLTLTNTKPSVDDTAARQARLDMAERVVQAGTWPTVQPLMGRLIAANSSGTEVHQLLQTILQTASPAAIAAAQRAMAERRDFVPHLESIKLPTLVLTGQLDPLAPPDATRQWAERISTSSYHEIPSVGHMTPMEAPAHFNRLVGEFLLSNR
ncbi:MAG: alpha/beta hydrolase [Pirellulaceae bacterium]|nr:alpha/beta hydrolase [Pirellulaceae bacterium]